MKVSFDFKGFHEKKAIGIAKHNRRDLSHIQGNLKDFNLSVPVGIDVSKIGNNLVRTDEFKNVSDLLQGRKVIGGLQAKTQEYTGFVISIGNAEDGTLPKEELKKFFAKSDEWIRKKFGGKYLLQSIEHWDEALPKIKILMANVVEYDGDDPKKVGKVYVSSRFKFNFENTKNRMKVREISKKLELQFHAEVASEWSSFGVEAPSEELGERGKVSKVAFMQEKLNDRMERNEKLRQENKRLDDKNKLVKKEVNDRLVDFNALRNVVTEKEWDSLMQRLRASKEAELKKLKEIKNKERTR